MDELTDSRHFVLAASRHQLSEGNWVRSLPRRYSDFYESLGAQVLLHAPRHDRSPVYFGSAVIENLEPDPDGTWMFVVLRDIEFFDNPVPTSDNGIPRENAPLNASGQPAFSFYSNGFRSISNIRFDDILAAAGPVRHYPPTGFSEDISDQDWDDAGDRSVSHVPASQHRSMQDRQIRARHRAGLIRHFGAFCCMSGVSLNVPGGYSLLQVSHFWPLGHGGPDELTNVGLKTPNIHPIYENGLVTIRSDYSFRFAPDLPPGFLAEFRGGANFWFLGTLASIRTKTISPITPMRSSCAG